MIKEIEECLLAEILFRSLRSRRLVMRFIFMGRQIDILSSLYDSQKLLQGTYAEAFSLNSKK